MASDTTPTCRYCGQQFLFSSGEQDFYVGRREDILRNVNGEWKIAHRKVMLDQNVLLAKNVSISF